MPDPELLVDHGDQGQHLAAAAIRYFEVEGAGDVKRFEIFEPGEGDVIGGPAAIDGDRDFILVLAVERPLVDRREALHDIHRMLGARDFDMGQ